MLFVFAPILILLSFILDLASHPSVFFPSSLLSLSRSGATSLRSLPVSMSASFSLPLSLLRSSVTRKRTLIAWHSAQTNTSGHPSGDRRTRRKRERDARGGGQYRLRRRQRAEREEGGRDASSYGADDDSGGGGGVGRRIEWEEEDCRRGRCQT